jgi:hypothetical protein
MRRGVMLIGLWGLAVVVLFRGPATRGAEGDDPCSTCDCAEAVAWAETGGSESYVLKAWDPNDPEKLGGAVTQANTPIAGRVVYSSDCLKDFSQEESGTYKRLTYSVSWNPTCKLKGNQTQKGLIPTKYDPESNNYVVPKETAKRYSCGPQD